MTPSAALGLGDVKFAAGAGIVLSWTSTSVLLTGIAVLAIAHLGWTAAGVALRSRRHETGMSGSALGPWILIGALAALST